METEMKTRSLISFTTNIMQSLEDAAKAPFMIDIPGKEPVVVASKSFLEQAEAQYAAEYGRVGKFRNHDK